MRLFRDVQRSEGMKLSAESIAKLDRNLQGRLESIQVNDKKGPYGFQTHQEGQTTSSALKRENKLAKLEGRTLSVEVSGKCPSLYHISKSLPLSSAEEDKNSEIVIIAFAEGIFVRAFPSFHLMRMIIVLTAVETENGSFRHFIKDFGRFSISSPFLAAILGERKALLRFKASLLDPSNRLSSWKQNNDCCTWQGVKCSKVTGHVIGLDLTKDLITSFKNLSGCSSHNLESLSLGYNELYGHFPEELGELKQLTELSIEFNRLSGPLPSSLGNLRALRVLDVQENQLSGEIPICLGQLSNLETFAISYNFFKGSLSETHFDKLSKLEHFYAEYMTLEFRVGYDWVPPFQLKRLTMRSSKIGGQFPQWLQTQKTLSFLDLSNCSIRGTLPKWLRYINLTELYLSNNHIEGPIPDLASSMITLDLSDNRINGSIPESLCEMKALNNLYLSNNHLSGNLLDCWGNFHSLDVARLSSNQFSGVIPNSIGGAYSLKRLHLNNNSLTGKLPSTLCNCTMLMVLDVGDNNLSGKLPEWNGKYLFYLLVLRLRNNDFYGAIPPAYCQLYQLQILDLADNKLTGNIPHCLGNFSRMANGGEFLFHR
ncbi:hypothetical protein DH2020_048760 [Rehmannia glutinosa]|uniref:Leucine-rich repeat-containing N-terminal plant-type domain-containing protein n=1 Tax=Rehmannia glutinosa TaxID=99300 RepID=A0ABR0U4R1_REHGL